MNFFAHAHLALRRRDDPAWLVGSMAPDLASMGRLRLGREARDPDLAQGIVFHHRSDDAFHGAPRFVELMRRSREDLRARGVGAGASLAIGHVGVELLLDGHLARQHGVPARFREALAGAGELAPALELRGDATHGRARWREVCRRLAAAPVPERYIEPAFVAERLIRILEPRPRLRVDPTRRDEVEAWAVAFLPQVGAEAEALLGEVEARLLGVDDAGRG